MNHELEVCTSIHRASVTTGTAVEKERDDDVISFSSLYPFECDECKKEITCDSGWMTHLLIRNTKCSLCGALLRGYRHLESHMLLAHNLHQCDQCMKHYTTRSSLLRHMAVHYLDPPLYECDACHAKFVRKTKLERHMMSAHESAPPPNELKHSYVCEKCGRKFVRQWNLDLHNVLVHEVGDEKRYQYTCYLCGRRFTKRGGWQRHLWKIHDVNADGLAAFSFEQKTDQKMCA